MATVDAEFAGKMRGPSLIIWLVGATVLLFLIWAKFAWIDEIVRAPGSVVSSSRPQIVQNLEGGILAEMLVSEGDIVETGDVLAHLHATRFVTAVDDLQDQIRHMHPEMRDLRKAGALHQAASLQLGGVLEQSDKERARKQGPLSVARCSFVAAETRAVRSSQHCFSC